MSLNSIFCKKYIYKLIITIFKDLKKNKAFNEHRKSLPIMMYLVIMDIKLNLDVKEKLLLSF